MKSRESAIQLKQFEIEEKSRRVGQIETMIEEFTRMINDLEHEIAAEQRRTGIEDEKHFAYSTFARAARQRRDNLNMSIEGLKGQLETAKAALDLAETELVHEKERQARESGAEADDMPVRVAS